MAHAAVASNDPMALNNQGSKISVAQDQQSPIPTFPVSMEDQCPVPLLVRFTPGDIAYRSLQLSSLHGVYGGGQDSAELPSDFGLTEDDMRFLDSLCAADGLRPARPTNSPEGHDRLTFLNHAQASSDGQQVKSKDTLHNSPLSHWTPDTEDNSYMDEEFLFVPKGLDLPGSTGMHRTEILGKSLSRDKRDQVFAIVAQNARIQATSPKLVMRCFPSAELLGTLVQAYFNHQRTEIDSWIHEPTLHLDNESTDMILALAAAGAVTSRVSAIQRLGYALMELARIQIYQKFEDRNILTRHLRYHQAYALILQIGFWSGDKRRMEIAESFRQPIVTMLRRAACFTAEGSLVITPSETDSVGELDQKWRQWVEQESSTRLVYHIFLHDIETSLVCSTNPLISDTELKLPLPYHRRLWEAKTAIEWRDVYKDEFSNHLNGKVPSIAEVIRDLSLLQRYPAHSDRTLAIFITIQSFATLVWNCNQVRPGLAGVWCAPLFHSWQRELQRMLEQIEALCIESGAHRNPLIDLSYQSICLSLCIPFSILEEFAGKDGEKLSAGSSYEVLQHLTPSQLRKAILHAGQVLRIFISMAPSQLNGFCVSCLYFAALTLWTYDLVGTRETMNQTSFPSHEDAGPSPDLIILNGDIDAVTARHFVVSGMLVPALSCANGCIPLTNPTAVMGLFHEALRSSQSDGFPPSKLTLHDVFSYLERSALPRKQMLALVD
ncbi:hypothetical protein AARAC_004313 [Aspergillus arachidicola]|uniref:Xylanolytic transcriptional activator regulatory domain-containing protein n=1 Tax=Aspergillus arachidicola TaxID=656916 RepID=A0A2G7G2L9_9EURO|nr:hypothetical protein AARAC_004313 [Aspergillus arachidicola]